MADMIDSAAQNDFTEESLKVFASSTRQHIKRGTCLYCAAQINTDAIYCDSSCREGHEEEEKIKRRQGR